MKFKLITIICLTLTFSLLKGQDYVYYSQYMFNGLSINPAYAGSQSFINITGDIREQWVGMQGAPSTQTLSVHSPIFRNQFGVGFTFINDRIGVTSQQEMSFHYSYKLKFPGYNLGLGLKMGLNGLNNHFNQLNLDDQQDQNFNMEKMRFQPVFGIGAYLKSQIYYAGISIPVLYKSNTLTYESKMNKLVFLTGGYLFKLDEDFDIKPSFLSKFNFGSTFEMDLNANVYYRNKVGLGLSYRSLNSLAIILELGYNNTYYLGYSYDMATTRLIRHQSGTHEISFNVYINRDINKKVVNPRYF